MTKKERITYVVETLREYDVYDLDVLNLIQDICRSAYENGTCSNEYLSKLVEFNLQLNKKV